MLKFLTNLFQKKEISKNNLINSKISESFENSTITIEKKEDLSNIPKDPSPVELKKVNLEKSNKRSTIAIERKYDFENIIGLSFERLNVNYNSKENELMVNGEITGEFLEKIKSVAIGIAVYSNNTIIDFTSIYLDEDFSGFDVFSETFYDLPEKPECILVFPKLN